jgi:bacteriocin biosynthesis cyclodehydratase domain-containing protein
MRPALKSGLLPVWRDRDTVQIGIDPRRAIALTGVGRAGCLIGLLDGSREREQVLAAASDRGIPVAATERLLTLLAAGGALDDFPASTLRELPQRLRTGLAAELATTSLAHADADGGARALARRRRTVIQVEGEGRIGRSVARILSAAGIGQVGFGPSHADRGRAAGQATASPDLVILVGRTPHERSDQLRMNRVAHLAVQGSEAIGIVGPLVLPGSTACMRCLDYRRASRDPAWPLILAQLTGRRPEPPACDAALAAAVAAQAAAQVLTAIDKAPAASAAANGTLELVLPDWRWRRRTWQPHPACPCCGTASRSAHTGR